MPNDLEIGEVRLTAAPQAYRRDGLLGWVTLTINGQLRLDGIAVRRTAAGGHTLSFPCRRDGLGRDHHLVRPINNSARLAIEEQVFEALGLESSPARR